MTTDTNPFSGVAVIAAPTAGPALATDKQVAFLTNLLADREHGETGVDLAKITKRNASLLIERLMAAPRKPGGERSPILEARAASGVAPITEGFWVLGTEVYKVQRAVHGSGHLYAKHLNEYGIFDYAAGAIGVLRSRGAEKLTLERARELGKLYGRCMICGATLTDETSIANGIGPVCGRRLS